MPELRSAARRSIVLCALLAVAACHGREPEELYITGNFLEARNYYNAKACAALKDEAAKHCNERTVQINEALVGAAQYLGWRANDRIRYGKQVQFNQYGEAIRSLELAIKILPPEHPSRSDFSAGIQRIRDTQSAFAVELDEQLGKLSTMLDTGTYDPEVWNDVRRTFERVRVLVIAVGKDDDRPRKLARELMQKFRNHGQYEHARIASDLYEAVDGGLPTPPSHSDTELVNMGVIHYMAQQQEAARQAKITALAREATTAFAGKKAMVAAGKARAALELGPTGRTARQMRAIVEQTEGATGQTERAKVARQVIAETSGEVTPVPVAKSVVAAADDDDTPVVTASVKEDEPSASRRPAAERLKEILKQYEKKKLFEALSGLEQLHHETLPAAERRKVNELRRLWAPDRNRLTTEIVGNADQLYVRMDETSLAEYQRALSLSPEGDVAKHINERIQTLKRILSY